jgi:bacterioferritin-associated ferredoxin
MNPDDLVCLCFRVSRRKLEKFVRLHQPEVASRLSECGSAGTGCGWCVPILEKIFLKQTELLDQLTPEQHQSGREVHLQAREGETPDSQRKDSPL